MGPSPTYHPPEGEECETSVEHGLPLWAEPAVGYCSRRPRPSPMWGSRFVGAREVGPWVGEQKPLGKSPVRGNPSPESTYLPTYVPNKEMEYDIPYPIYIPYIGPYNVPLGVICQGRVVTCFTPPLKTTATGRKQLPKRNVAVTNSSKWQVSRNPFHRESNLRRQSRSRPYGR